MIRVEDVSLKIKNYDVLKHISLDIKRGEAVGLIGNNGCGKTMLMKCICGFQTRYSGEIWVNGKRIGKDVEFAENTGFIIETPGFVPYMTAYENLKVLAEINKKIHKDAIRHYIRLVGLEPDNKKGVRKYSLGMRQRLGIAQALMEDPEILILDEPFNGLDKNMAATVRELLVEEKRKGKTILLASHNELDISYICDRTCEMDAGEIINIAVK